MTMPTSEFVDALAKQIRVTYCSEVRSHAQRRTGRFSNFGLQPIPRLDGGTDGRGARHKPVWVKLANFAIQNQLVVTDWIRSVFENTLGNVHPSCNQLTTPAALAVARDYRKQATTEVRESFLRQQDKVNGEIRRLQEQSSRPEIKLAEPTVILRLGILVDDVSVTPLFRYCVSHNKKQFDLARHLYVEAMSQYLARRDIYDEVFGDQIPKEFQAAATQVSREAAAGTYEG